VAILHELIKASNIKELIKASNIKALKMAQKDRDERKYDKYNQPVIAALREKEAVKRRLREAGTSLAALAGIKDCPREPITFGITVAIKADGSLTDPGVGGTEVELLLQGELLWDRYVIFDNRVGVSEATRLDALLPYVYVIHKSSRELCAVFYYTVEAEVFAWWVDRRVPRGAWPEEGSRVSPELKDTIIRMANEVEGWNICGVRGMHGVTTGGEEDDETAVEVKKDPVLLLQTDPVHVKEPTITAELPDKTLFPVSNNGNLFIFYEKLEGGYVVVEEPPNAASFSTE